MRGLQFRVSGGTSMRNKFIVMCYMPWISQSSLKVGEIVELTTRPLDHQWIHIIQLWASKQKRWNMDYWTPSANIIRLFYAAKVVNRKVKGNQKRNGCLMAVPSKCSKLSRGGKRPSFSSALCCFAPITRVAGKPWNRSIKGSYVWVQLFRKGFPNKKYTGLFKDAYRWLYKYL